MAGICQCIKCGRRALHERDGLCVLCARLLSAAEPTRSDLRILSLIVKRRARVSAEPIDDHEMINMRFGRLVVVKRADPQTGNRHLHFECKCDCGRDHLARGDALRRGLVTSCGCRCKDEAIARAARMSRQGDGKFIAVVP